MSGVHTVLKSDCSKDTMAKERSETRQRQVKEEKGHFVHLF